MLWFNVFPTLLFCTVAVSGQYEQQQYKHSVRQASKSNVLVIMTDDQGTSFQTNVTQATLISIDLLLNSLSVMPKLQALIGDNGTTYSKHYCQNALCCPSRTSFFTGKTSHNTNVCMLLEMSLHSNDSHGTDHFQVTDVLEPYGNKQRALL